MPVAAALILAFAITDGATAARVQQSEALEAVSSRQNTSIFRSCGSRVPTDNPGLVNSDATPKCQTCLEDDVCEWCPLTQTCSNKYLGFGCTARPAPNMHALDKSCRDADECATRPSSIATMMETMYGKKWQDGDTHIDAVRCLQWSLDWSVAKDPNMPGQDDETVGRWGCFSALVRDGILAGMGELSMPLAPSDGGGKGILKNSTTWKPLLCDLVEMKADSNACYVRGFSLEQFKKLRRPEDQPNGKGGDVNVLLAASIRSGPLISFSPGAGKSGSGFSRTTDDKFKIKLGLKYSSKMNEPYNLISMVEGVTREGKRAETLSDHLERNPSSLLNRYYGLFKAAFGDTRPYVLVMGDAFYELDKEAKYQKEHGAFITYQRYDLKGESRNQFEMKHKSFTLINGDFREREHNRVWLGDEQCMQFRGNMRTDGDFLATYGIIDYSLLALAVRHPEGARDVTCDGTPGAPFCMADTEYVYSLSVIDYLNNFNWFKRTESSIKGGKFQQYELQMLTFAEKICRTSSELATHEKVMGMMLKKFDSIRAAFDAADDDHDGWIYQQDVSHIFNQIGLEGEDAEHILDGCDQDVSGHLEFKEFACCME